MRDLAGALVRPGRAAVRRRRHGEHVDAAVGHRLELAAQLHRLRPGLPRVHDALLAGVALDLVEQEVDPRREHQAIVGERAAAAECDDLLDAVDGDRFAVQHVHAVLAQPLVAERDVAHRAVAAEHQVRDRAGDELARPVD